MSDTVTLKGLLADLHAERVARMPAADLQLNIDQRAQLVEEFDPAAAVQPGDVLDPYTLEDVRGPYVALDELVADGPAVLVFFRHAGCPACNIALPYYRDELAPGLEQLGARLVAVSPQVPERLVEIADRHSFPFTVASDRGNILAGRLGITFVANEASRRYARSKGAELLETGCELIPVVGQRDVAGRAAREAEEDEHRGAVGHELVERDVRAPNVLQRVGVEHVARLHRRRRVELLDELSSLVDVQLQIGGRHARNALGVQVGQESLQRDRVGHGICSSRCVVVGQTADQEATGCASASRATVCRLRGTGSP
ncbi:MAG: hypothetical protein QOI43_2257, partial [Gaiellales bacterium]|nr:hypothetical protein [Gaiellales bacterium]